MCSQILDPVPYSYGDSLHSGGAHPTTLETTRLPEIRYGWHEIVQHASPALADIAFMLSSRKI